MCLPYGKLIMLILGALLQMIEFSQQSVSGDSYETGMALFVSIRYNIMNKQAS
jgi:purine-cytosine permease-like protein